MLIERGINPLANSAASLVSSIIASVVSAAASNAIGDKALIPLFKTVSKLAIPFLFIATLLPK